MDISDGVNMCGWREATRLRITAELERQVATSAPCARTSCFYEYVAPRLSRLVAFALHLQYYLEF